MRKKVAKKLRKKAPNKHLYKLLKATYKEIKII